MWAILIWAFVIYFFYKISPSKYETKKYDSDKIKNELIAVYKESKEDIKKNEDVKIHYSNLKVDISSKLDNFRIEEEFSHDDLINTGKILKTMVEVNESSDPCYFRSESKSGSAYAIVLICDEIIKLSQDKQIVLNGLINNCKNIISLIQNNDSEKIIYEEIQELRKYENAINNLSKKIQFKRNCIWALKKDYSF